MEIEEAKSFIQLFEQQVRLTPDACATCCVDEVLSYEVLNKQANLVARRLQQDGVGPEVIVGLLAERSITFLITMLGIFKAGGAYLPLDPHAPVEHLARVLAQPDIALVLVSRRFQELLGQAMTHLSSEIRPHILHLDLLFANNEQEDSYTQLSRLSNLAYIIFTSGSTGIPKGVMIEQRNMLNHLYAKIDGLQLNSTDRVAQSASQGFDISMWEFLAVLLAGGCVHIVPGDITHHPMRMLCYIAETGITIWEVVPSFLFAMLRALDASKALPPLKSLRWLVSVGEALPAQLCRQWFSYYPSIPLMNAYGPTECADSVAHYPLYETPTDESMIVSIGRAPIRNNHLYVLDTNLQRLPVGVAGELYVGGIGPGRGYLHDPCATATAFLPDPYGGTPGMRLYRTGDLVRHLSDGCLEYICRVDYQVKIRGFRIELGEIEAVLRTHPLVAQAVVLVRENAHHEKYLVAYVVPQVGQTVTPHELELYLQTKLARYKIPGAFILLDTLPLTRNGKIDRKALIAITCEQDDTPQIVSALTSLEQILTEIWTKVLGKKSVGRYDDFLALGGHSLLAIELMAQIEERLGVQLQFQEFFEQRTIAQMATLIETGNAPVVVNKKGNHRPSPLPDDVYPITYFQRKYVQEFQKNPEACSGVLVEAYLITGSFVSHCFRTALARLVAAHPILHSHVVSIEKDLYQQPVHDYQLLINEHVYETSDSLHLACKDIVQRESMRPFRLFLDIPLRATILRSQEQVSCVVLSIHHIAVDAHSLIMLRKQLFDLYEDEEVLDRRNVEGSFAEYAWQQRQVTLQKESATYRFWLEQVCLAQSMRTNLVSSWHADAAGTQKLEINTRQGDALHTLCQTQQITPCMCFMAIFALFLCDIFDVQHVAIGLTMSMRGTPQSHNVIGPLINHGIFCLDLAAMPLLEDIYKRIKYLTFSYYKYIDFPVEYFRENPHLVGENPSSSLFDFLLNYYAAEEAIISARSSLIVEPLVLTQEEKTIMRCVTLNVYEHCDRSFTCEIRYRKALFDRRRVSYLRDCLHTVIQHVLHEESSHYLK